MNRRTSNKLTDAVLRDLDPAQTVILTQEERQRANELLARIVASPSPHHFPEESHRSRLRRSLVLIGLFASGVAVPAWLLGGSSAFASWTPKPEPLSVSARVEAADTCRTALEMPANGDRVLSAERRGGWIYVLIASPQAEGACLMPDDLVGAKNVVAERRNGFFGSYTTDPVEDPTVAPKSIDETQSMNGSVSTSGRLPLGSDEGWFTWVSGYVGSEVIGVTVHPPVGPDVEASVEGGRFAGWWPSAVPSSKNLEVMEAWDYTVTLADGTTQRVRG